ncbi:MAG: methylenetetrahydrofolate reductase C-terminal domain-containing protein [Chloroflexi bacterium]|nr:methylenetetrahydrofolate reductase C-terminal domain-containing protein [Chloroflexota bacterium]
MIGQTQKPIEEVLGFLDGKEKVVLVGCGGCATVFHTGGEPEVKEMADILTKRGKNVLAAVVVPFGEFTCYAPWSKERLKPYRQQIEDCDAILMLSCGDGLQVVRELILEGEYSLVKPIYPTTNPIGHMGGGPSLFREKCQQCGECLLGQYAGICPMTQCAKGLLNGPCGGAKNGKCEQEPEHDCAWVLIYERLKKLGELDKIKEFVPPKDYSKMKRPRSLEVTPLVL